jgi:hypothetical protein
MFKLSVVLISIFCVSGAAHADWEYTEWGQSPKEVVAASGGDAHLVPARPYPGNENYTINVMGEYRSGDYSFDATFRFQGDELGSVQLELQGPTSERCGDLRSLLGDVYGDPVRETARRMVQIALWQDRDHDNLVSFYILGGFYVPGEPEHSEAGCAIVYYPLAAESTSGR